MALWGWVAALHRARQGGRSYYGIMQLLAILLVRPRTDWWAGAGNPLACDHRPQATFLHDPGYEFRLLGTDWARTSLEDAAGRSRLQEPFGLSPKRAVGADQREALVDRLSGGQAVFRGVQAPVDELGHG